MVFKSNGTSFKLEKKNLSIDLLLLKVCSGYWKTEAELPYKRIFLLLLSFEKKNQLHTSLCQWDQRHEAQRMYMKVAAWSWTVVDMLVLEQRWSWQERQMMPNCKKPKNNDRPLTCSHFSYVFGYRCFHGFVFSASFFFLSAWVITNSFLLRYLFLLSNRRLAPVRCFSNHMTLSFWSF